MIILEDKETDEDINMMLQDIIDYNWNDEFKHFCEVYEMDHYSSQISVEEMISDIEIYFPEGKDHVFYKLLKVKHHFFPEPKFTSIWISN